MRESAERAQLLASLDHALAINAVSAGCTAPAWARRASQPGENSANCGVAAQARGSAIQPTIMQTLLVT